MKYPKLIEKLIMSFSKYPGIGRKSAERIVMYTISKFDEDEIQELSSNLSKLNHEIKHCNICGVLSEHEICEICSDGAKDNGLLMIVEDSKDVFTLEKIGNYNGKYHVLGGLLSPMDGIGPDQLRIKALLERLKDESIKEVIIALSASVEGETTSLYINKILENTDLLVTRIAHGLPVGGGIEQADEITLIRALEGRRKI